MKHFLPFPPGSVIWHTRNQTRSGKAFHSLAVNGRRTVPASVRPKGFCRVAAWRKKFLRGAFRREAARYSATVALRDANADTPLIMSRAGAIPQLSEQVFRIF